MTHSKRTRKLLSILFAVIVGATLCCQVAFADSDPKADFKSGITNVYGNLRKIATGGGVLALAGCGIKMIGGDDKETEKVKKACVIIITAVVCVWLLPLFMRFGKGMFGAPWNPRALG